MKERKGGREEGRRGREERKRNGRGTGVRKGRGKGEERGFEWSENTFYTKLLILPPLGHFWTNK
jgi:hypothetical protein